jgi:tetratricopeptide (TPR) repeat protein
MSRLVELFREAFSAGMEPAHTEAESRTAFRQKMAARYTEGTLQRLLEGGDVEARMAAAVALGMDGTMRSNAILAARLHDSEPAIRRESASALWAIWFRAEGEWMQQELERLSRLPDLNQALRGLTALIHQTPTFAEAINQRAIVYFRMGEFKRSSVDCEKVLKLNSFHFGAQAGLGQCLLKLNKPRVALNAFRRALRINPGLEDVSRMVRELEDALGEGGTRDKREG